MANTNRAEYFKERRKTKKSFNVLIDKNKAEKFDNWLIKQNKTKSTWLNEKIDQELKK